MESEQNKMLKKIEYERNRADKLYEQKVYTEDRLVKLTMAKQKDHEKLQAKHFNIQLARKNLSNNIKSSQHM